MLSLAEKQGQWFHNPWLLPRLQVDPGQANCELWFSQLPSMSPGGTGTPERGMAEEGVPMAQVRWEAP